MKRNVFNFSLSVSSATFLVTTIQPKWNYLKLVDWQVTANLLHIFFHSFERSDNFFYWCYYWISDHQYDHQGWYSDALCPGHASLTHLPSPAADSPYICVVGIGFDILPCLLIVRGGGDTEPPKHYHWVMASSECPVDLGGEVWGPEGKRV